jgi:MFS family permease
MGNAIVSRGIRIPKRKSDRSRDMNDQSDSLSRAWSVVALLWVVACLNYLDRQLIITMGAPIKGELHIGDADFGLFSSMFLWIYGLLSPFAGYIADRVPRKRIIIGSLLVWSLVTWFTGHVQSFSQMLTARALMGISEAFYIPAAVALIVDYHRGKTRSRATGLHLSGAYVGAILGGSGGWLASHYGWRFGFQLFGVGGVIYAIFLMMVLPNPSCEEGDAASGKGTSETIRFGVTLKELLTSRGFLFLLGMNALMGAAFWTIKNWLPMFFHAELHVDLAKSGIYGTAFFNLAAFGGMLLAGTIADRWSQRNPRARSLVPAIGFCIAAPCFFSIGLAQTIPWILAAIVMAGAAQGSLDANLMPTVCNVIDARFRASGYGMLNFISTLTGGLMIYIGGRLKDADVSFLTTFKLAAGLILLAGLILFQVRPSKSRKEG